MEPSELRARLHQPAPVPERSRFCPEDERLAAYYDACLDVTERDSLQHHLAGCEYCQARLGLLARLQSDDTEGTAAVPGDLLAVAKQAGRGRPRRGPSGAPAWAAAAMLVLTVSVVAFLGKEPISTTPRATPVVDEEARALRSLAPVASPALLAPIEAARVAAGDLVVRWAPVEGALFYDVTVMSDAGELLVDERVAATEWTAGADALAPGAAYFVRVEAALADTRRLATDYVMFHLEEGD